MAFTNRIRLPFKLTRAQFPETKTVYRKADGSSKTLSVIIQKTYEGETDWLPEKWHQRLVIALGHDNVTYEGDKYLGGVSKDGDYSIDWPTFLDYPTGKAKFSVQVTPFDATNSNCMTCEQATQVSLGDDFFQDFLEEDSDYTMDAYSNDTICCYPAAFSITSYDTTYIESINIDQAGIITLHTKASFTSGNGIKLATYRVTCPNGGFDEAEVYGSLHGDVPGCLAPSNIVFSGITVSSVHIEFTDSPSTPDHYLWRLYKASAPGVIVQQGTCTRTSDLFSLEPGTDYIWYVRSQCGPRNDDDTASNFISGEFSTITESNICGSYSFSFNDAFHGSDYGTYFTYLDCNGTYQSVFITNHKTKTACVLQTSPGSPVSIVFDDPGGSTAYIGLC